MEQTTETNKQKQAYKKKKRKEKMNQNSLKQALNRTGNRMDREVTVTIYVDYNKIAEAITYNTNFCEDLLTKLGDKVRIMNSAQV